MDALLKDSQWGMIDGELCRVIDFTPFLHSVKDGKVLSFGKESRTPYASITVECTKLPEKIKGFVCHKLDFMHLWLAFREREIKQDEEVLIIWTKKHYNKLCKIFAFSLPRLWVMICPKGAFELETNPHHKPELRGEARYNATKPIVEWEPKVMK